MLRGGVHIIRYSCSFFLIEQVERFSQAVTFVHRGKSNISSVVPCANKKVGWFKILKYAETVDFLVGEIGVLVCSFFPVASKPNLGENQL